MNLLESLLAAAVTGTVIEIDGILYGSFEDREAALTWALSMNRTPFKIHTMIHPRMASAKGE